MSKVVRKGASVTVPICLSLSMLAVLILGLIEGARYYGLKEDAKEWTKLTTESLFAGYQPFLSDEYDMFFLDGDFATGAWDIGEVKEEMEALLYDNLGRSSRDEGINLYAMNPLEVEVLEYALATDDQGKVFEMQAAKNMKDVIGQRVAEKILEKIQRVEEKKQESGDPEKSIQNANTMLEEIARQAETEPVLEAQLQQALSENLPKSEQGLTVEETVVENPLEVIKPMQGEGVLTMVLQAGSEVSKKKVSLDNCLMKRDCQVGTYKQEGNPGWYERILMQEFVKPLVGNYLTPKEEGALSYGVEYLICGKESDLENLKGTTNQLVLLREIVNFLYLQKDEVKSAEALAVATAVAGASANPAVISVVKQGILAAWAYVESLCDVKALLSGKKVDLMKNSSNWRTQLSKLGEALLGEPVSDIDGLSYENYLDVLLYSKTVRQIAYRSMDLMEWDMRNEENYANCRMDHMMIGLKMQAEYSARTVFSGIFGEDSIGGYVFWEQAEYVYGQ